MIFVALAAILLPLILLGGLNLPATRGMSISAAVVIITAYLFWHLSPTVILASILQSLHKALPILWILFGALLMLNCLRATGAIDRINQGFKALSADMRLQTILVAFLFGGLIEGVSGFGTPAMVTAPLLIALGFSPMAAVILALVADSTPAAFGAVGTPLTVGLSNVSEKASLLNLVGLRVTQLDLFVGALMPATLILILIFSFGPKKQRWQQWLAVLPWALLIGFAYSGIALLSAWLIGYEFISILAPLGTLIVAIISIKQRWLLPKSVQTDPWQVANSQPPTAAPTDTTQMSLLKAWFPYLLVVLLLLTTRVWTSLQTLLTHYANLSWKNILGFSTINSDWELLYSPGTILTVAAIIGLLVQAKTLKPLAPTAKQVTKSMGGTAIALVVTLIMVQVFTNSGLNSADLPSMPMYIAKFVAKYLAGIWIIIAPFLGELGSFVTGSTTVSTLTFGQIQADIAANAHLSEPVVLAAQLIGAAAGNMICVHNIVAVSSVVGLSGQEGSILRQTILPALGYAALIGIAGLVLVSLV
ncbi:L-lactate permease [Lactiplantibacillus fabifermentans]|uniref:L-lactate permease n=2 Tax=Lactiplantibacillus fabifermentans TaxID=483011 RepID=A0A0R2NRE4_9LACO|nr:L-lactate permease [Lactiplantibacillus fabifermentans]ETY74366.1 lactate permease [Lactiplantibacillus fabifermentans T30PCM01]KRO28271.1 l-lactate transport protein [Lactiplantibacillus fabifermentans DSM 21115]